MTRHYSEGDVVTFFSVLRHKRKSQQDTLRHLDRYLSTRFNIFELLRPNELLLSTVLAELLNPAGKHGQGSQFLQSFMERIGREDLAQRHPQKVRVEAPTKYLPHSIRRFDVLLEYEDDRFAFAIENKPWAKDQNKQVSDYLDELRSGYGDAHCLVYLTHNGDTPDISSIPAETRKRNQDRGNLVLLSFRDDIRRWLEVCINQCASDKYRWFLRDFLAYIQEEFPGTPYMEESDAARL